MAPLAGQHAIITGGGRGIGAAIARNLAEVGARVTIVSRTSIQLERKAAELHRDTGAEVVAEPADVTVDDEVHRAFTAANVRFGPPTILVNNAGNARAAPFARTTRALWDEMIAVNLTSTYLCIQEALVHMRPCGSGRIINVASTASLRGYAYVAAYCAAKHGVVGLTRALALELASTSITVNAVCPGYTDTPMLDEAARNIANQTGCTEAEAKQRLASNNPQKRLVEPAEVAAAVGWLCSEQARSVTGIALPICGGEPMA
ncbi:MAG: SDR family NAD(P)-dependent oxidoreductase [Nannocystaceae bacterium]